tara:strand:- start:13416 stop:14978 length:1563 start_codon:yes stop_codon:yes gene_type:complete
MNQIFISFCNKYNLDYVFENDNIHIKAKDVGILLNIKQINSSIRYFNSNDKKSFLTKTNSGEHYLNYLTINGLKKILSSKKRLDTYKYISELGFEIINYYNPLIEVSTLDYIISFIPNEKYIHQYQIKKYRIDLYLPNYNIAIECYENYHNSSKQKIYDEKRIENIKAELKCNFLIYYPQLKNNSIQNTIITLFKIINNKKNDIEIEKNTKMVKSKNKTDQLVKDIEMAKLQLKEKELEDAKIKNNIRIKELELEQEKINLIKLYADKPDILKYLIPQPTEPEVKIETKTEYIQPVLTFKPKKTNYEKIQKYDPITLKLIETYPSYIETIRNALPDKSITMSQNVLKDNIKNNWIYKGYRWWSINSDAEDKEYTIPPTEEKLGGNVHKDDYICMLNLEKTEILQVFASQKDACIQEKVTGGSIANAIRRDSKSCNKYWTVWTTVSDELKEKFLESNELPEKTSASNSIKINQINPINNEIIKTFNSIQEIQRTFQCSRLTLKNAIETQTTMKHFLWNYSK